MKKTSFSPNNSYGWLKLMTVITLTENKYFTEKDDYKWKRWQVVLSK